MNRNFPCETKGKKVGIPKLGEGNESNQRQNSEEISFKSILFQSHKPSQNDLWAYIQNQLQG